MLTFTAECRLDAFTRNAYCDEFSDTDSLRFSQKLVYLLCTPVEAGCMDDPAGWLYSSARDYSSGKRLLEVQVLEG